MAGLYFPDVKRQQNVKLNLVEDKIYIFMSSGPQHAEGGPIKYKTWDPFCPGFFCSSFFVSYNFYAPSCCLRQFDFIKILES